MKKCLYIQKANLPPSASPEQMVILLSAFKGRRVKVMRQALRWLIGPWKMTVVKFVETILDHLMTNGMVFKKYAKGSSCLLENKLQAGVCIREPDEDDDYDDGTVYVEFIIIENEVILIFDSHEHEAGIRRLPNKL